MRTSKPFSTISYNSDEFLQSKLNDYVRRNVLSFWVYIEHFPEDDETKKHKHLFMVPNGQVETSQFVNDLKEIDLNNLDKPLGIMPIKSSKFADWYLYCCHNADYLATKGQLRIHHYQNSDFVVSDNDYFLEEIHHIDFSKFNKVGVIKDAIQNDISFQQLVFNGQVPIQQFRYFQEVYNYISDIIGHGSETYRNDREGHQNKYIEDLATGEVIEIKKSSDKGSNDN